MSGKIWAKSWIFALSRPNKGLFGSEMTINNTTTLFYDLLKVIKGQGHFGKIWVKNSEIPEIWPLTCHN